MVSSFSRVAVAALALAQLSLLAHASVFSCSGGSLYFTAHPDDDLLFQSPALYDDIAGGKCVLGVSLTSGDSGYGSTYAQSREAGNEAAWAEMAGVASNWTQVSAVFGTQPIILRTLAGAPNVQKMWMRLPDGDVDGSGYAVTGYETLRELYFGSIGSITTQDNSATYTLANLNLALAQIMTASAPATVRSLDYLSQYDAGDHSDHLTVGRLTQSLMSGYAPSASFQGYMGYPSANWPPTISTSSSDFTHKTNAFFTYTPYDSGECTSWSNCVSTGRGEANWMLRSMPVNSTTASQTTIGSAQTQSTLPSGYNVALGSNATASSSWGGSAYYAPSTPHCAIDGVIGGYPGNYSAEWVSNGGLVGSWFKLTWSVAQDITNVVLYDRENEDDWITGGTLTYSDGTTQVIGALENDGSMTVFAVPGGTKSTTSVLFTVTSVYYTTSNVGLGEFQVFSPNKLATTASNTTTSSNSTSVSYGTVDIALSSTATASSYSVDQGPSAAIDGVIGGYSDGVYTEEWASNGQGAGAWITLTWPSAVSVAEAKLYDRPNTNDQVTSGTLSFSDGSSVAVGSLNNDGSATTVTFASRSITWVTFTVLTVSSTTSNVGLAEFQLYAALNTTNTTTSANSTTVAYSTIDLALNSTATASSAGAGQGASAAIDGVIGGYSDGLYTQEWASNGQGAGAWIELTWTAAQKVAEVILYDRPNLNDQITSGTLTFSDGSTVAVGSLNNDGSATPVTFSARNTTSILFTVGTVSSTTSNAGLAEFQVYGPAGSTLVSTNTTSSSNSSSVAYSSVDVALNATASASSAGAGQGASAAIDGVIGGYSDGLYTQEWASASEGVGAWLKLTWGYTVNLAEAILYDRPNLNDQVTGGTLTFSDGSSVTVGSLNNDGSATKVTFAARNVTSALFTVTSVSSTTSDVGLAEIQFYGIKGTNADLGSNSTTTNSTSSANSTTVAYSTIDLALNSTATASSAGAGQGASAAIDGVIGGYSDGLYTQEWASNGQGAGAWIKLVWTAAQKVAEVILYDRPNLNDQITSGTLTFSDGSTVAVGSLNNDGSATPVTFSARNTTSILFTVGTVSSTTSNAGLAEFQVYGPAGSTLVSTNTTSTNTTSSSNSTSISYSSVDIALNATATASSAGAGQGATQAIDGVIGGYSDGLYTEEWASNGQGVGAWLLLSWNYTVNLAEAILYDRPNLDDQVLGGTLTFSDGSSVTVGELNNDGSATKFTFAPRNVTSVKFTVTSVSSSTSDVGLSEIQLYGVAGSNVIKASISATSSVISSTVTSKISSATGVNSTATVTSAASTATNGTSSIVLTTSGLKNATSSAVPTNGTATFVPTSGLTLAVSTATNLTASTATAKLNSTSSVLPTTSSVIKTSSVVPTTTSVTKTSSVISTSSVIPTTSKVTTTSSVLPTTSKTTVTTTTTVITSKLPTTTSVTSVVKTTSTSSIKTSSTVITTTSKLVTTSSTKPTSTSATKTTSSVAATPTVSNVVCSALLPNLVGQCGGAIYIGLTCCNSGTTCQYVNDYLWSCLAPTATATTSSAAAATSTASSCTLKVLGVCIL